MATYENRFSDKFPTTPTTAGLLPPPTLMSDELATMLGYKEYTQADVTITGDNAFSISYASLIPSKMQNGKWRLEFHIDGTTNSVTSGNVTIPGITSVNVFQKIVASTINQSVSDYHSRFDPNGGNIYYNLSGLNSGQLNLWGAVILTGKPSWAV